MSRPTPALGGVTQEFLQITSGWETPLEEIPLVPSTGEVETPLERATDPNLDVAPIPRVPYGIPVIAAYAGASLLHPADLTEHLVANDMWAEGDPHAPPSADGELDDGSLTWDESSISERSETEPPRNSPPDTAEVVAFWRQTRPVVNHDNVHLPPDAAYLKRRGGEPGVVSHRRR